MKGFEGGISYDNASSNSTVTTIKPKLSVAWHYKRWSLPMYLLTAAALGCGKWSWGEAVGDGEVLPHIWRFGPIKALHLQHVVAARV